MFRPIRVDHTIFLQVTIKTHSFILVSNALVSLHALVGLCTCIRRSFYIYFTNHLRAHVLSGRETTKARLRRKMKSGAGGRKSEKKRSRMGTRLLAKKAKVSLERIQL